jgi:hypothetical protein
MNINMTLAPPSPIIPIEPGRPTRHTKVLGPVPIDETGIDLLDIHLTRATEANQALQVENRRLQDRCNELFAKVPSEEAREALQELRDAVRKTATALDIDLHDDFGHSEF